jgi:hypothetical protein
MTTLDEFAILVRRYCAWADNVLPIESVRAEMLFLRELLAVLYAHALTLPQVDFEWVDRVLSHEDYQRMYTRFGSLPVGYYGRALDPLNVDSGELSLGDLADDLADIWRDLREGLLLFDSGRCEAAGASWQESFAIHWGEHAVNALAITQFWLGQNRGP